MAKSTRMFGPFRYHIPDSAPFTETRMSLLWLAEALDTQHKTLGEKVVLKVARLKEEQFSLANQRAIENEVRWLRQLDHPGIIKLRPIAEEGTARPGLQIYQARSSLPGEPWFVVTDYLPGGTLLNLVEERKKLSVRLALQIAHRLAETLAYVHTQGCIHRDFKPQNVLFIQKPDTRQLSEQSRPILIDFGIANHRGEQQLVAGTEPWLAPECKQAWSSGTKLAASPSMDMYALGLTLYYLLTGQRPPKATPNLATQLWIQPSDLGDIAPRQRVALATAINQIIHKSIDDEPNKRLSAQQFATEVANLLPQLSGRPSIPLQQHWPWVGGIAVTGMLALVLFYRNPPQPLPPLPTATPLPSAAGLVTATAVATPTPDITATFATEVARAVAEALTPTAGTVTSDNATATTPVLAATQTDTATPAIQPTLVRNETATQPPAATNTAVLSPPTATRDATQTPIPTSTPQPTPTPTVAPTATATQSPTPTRLATPTPPPLANTTLTLLEPLRSELSGRQTFRWVTDAVLGENEAFEMIFWEVGKDPLNDGFGPFGTTTISRIEGNLDIFASETGTRFLVRGREYEWGVRLVQTNPYIRLRYLGGAHQFYYGGEPSNSNNNSNDNGNEDSPPTEAGPTNTPRG